MGKFTLTFEIEVDDDAYDPRIWASDAILANLSSKEQLVHWSVVKSDAPKSARQIRAFEARAGMIMCFKDPGTNWVIGEVISNRSGGVRIARDDGSAVEWYDFDTIIWVKDQ